MKKLGGWGKNLRRLDLPVSMPQFLAIKIIRKTGVARCRCGYRRLN
ncbi:hypothetical protein [Microcoleus sp. FACHB-672]|nr:hypothetical protein [Microcoleus sp. FACHB-672]MBD2044031.1 hypothetical protein [Microcoleus sp. FACHB-672]